MKFTIIILAVLLSVCNRLAGQTRTIYGRVIGEDLKVTPYVEIRNKDFQIIGKVDTAGKFKIEIPRNTQTLIFTWLECEFAPIKLGDCDTIEIVMMDLINYEWMRSSKIDRIRLTRFNKLPDLHLQAYKKGIFAKETICYYRDFKPDKPALDSIGNADIRKYKHLRLVFKKLKVGDTIEMPFREDHGGDGTDRTLLSYYSSYYPVTGERKRYSFVVKCVVTGKKTRRWQYDLICRVVKCDRCESPSVLMGKVLKIGSVFSYDMKNCKILEQ